MDRRIKRAIKLRKSIEKYEKRLKRFQAYVGSIKMWIKQDKAQLANLLNSLEESDLLLYGQESGFMKETK